MTDKASLLAEHYQKTFELTLSTWEKRNHTFLVLLVLLAVVGFGTLLTFNVPQAEPLLLDFTMKLFAITDSTRSEELRRSFPYSLIQSVLLIVIAYLTLILYHRTATIQRFYKYMASLESELREIMELADSDVCFTRESLFYEKHKPILGHFVAVSYITMLGGLLFAFLGYRVYSDFNAGNLTIGIVDALLSIPTIIFFIGYARSS